MRTFHFYMEAARIHQQQWAEPAAYVIAAGTHHMAGDVNIRAAQHYALSQREIDRQFTYIFDMPLHMPREVYAPPD